MYIALIVISGIIIFSLLHFPSESAQGSLLLIIAVPLAIGCLLLIGISNDKALVQEMIFERFPSYEEIDSYHGMKYDVQVEDCDDGKRVTIVRRKDGNHSSSAHGTVFYITPDYNVANEAGLVIAPSKK